MASHFLYTACATRSIFANEIGVFASAFMFQANCAIVPVKFSTGVGPNRKSYDLTAQAGREQPIRVQAGQFQAVRVEIEGWLEQDFGHIAARAPYRATLWMSPELRRPIRFEVKSRTSSAMGLSAFMIDETAELIAISRD